MPRVRLDLLILMALAGCVTRAPPERPAPLSPAPSAATDTGTATQSLPQQIEQSRKLVSAKQFAQADALLRQVLASPQFAALPPGQQHQVLQLSVMAAQDHRRALALLRRACDMPDADVSDWGLRVVAAIAAGDEHDTVVAFTTLALRWPDALPRLQPDDGLERAMRIMDKVGSDADRYTVLNALFGVRLSEETRSQSIWWYELALLQLMRGEREPAAGSLLRVNDAYVATSVAADRRFDPVRGLIEGVPPPPELAKRTINSALHRTQVHPDRLEPVEQLTELLVEAQRYQEALQVTDAVMERIEAAGSKSFVDSDQQYPWILQSRSDALWGLGRWQQAITQLETASKLPEVGGDANVSQVINLAGDYAYIGQPQDTLATLQRVGIMSPFGQMQLQLRRVEAESQLHHPAAVNKTLEFLRQHRDDAPSALQMALLAADREDEGAALLKARLADARLRRDALLAVQRYDDGMEPPYVVARHRRWAALVSRPDVQRAIERVGRTAHYPLDRPNY